MKLMESVVLLKTQFTWQRYLPAAIMGGLTIACVIDANSNNLRYNAALASVYSLTELALKENQTKVVKIPSISPLNLAGVKGIKRYCKE
jgi:hypothetical protein